MKTNKLLPLLLLTVLAPYALRSQHNLMMYSMDQVPQRIYENPAFIPEQKLWIGIPALSGIRVSWCDPFTYNDILTREADDSLSLTFDKLMGKVSDNNYIRIYSDVSIFDVGTKIADGRFFLNFGLRERAVQHSIVPGDLFYLAWYGNKAPQIYGKTVPLSPVINTLMYDEWGVTFSGYTLKNKLTYGATAKYLGGRINTKTRKSAFDFYTDSATYDLYVRSDLELQTSGIDSIENYFDQPVSSIIFPENRGFAVDLGATYRINDRFSVDASVLDLGYIRWKAGNLTLVSHDPGAEVSFDGFNLTDFMTMVEGLEKFGRELTDSIKALVEIDSVYDQKYTTWLPTRINLGGTYTINDRSSVHLLLNGICWDNRLYPALSVSYSYHIRNILGLYASYNMFSSQYWNIGAGFSVKAGPMQFYLATDDLTGVIFYKSTNNASIQFGINIAIYDKQEGSPVTEPVTTSP